MVSTTEPLGRVDEVGGEVAEAELVGVAAQQQEVGRGADLERRAGAGEQRRGGAGRDRPGLGGVEHGRVGGRVALGEGERP